MRLNLDSQNVVLNVMIANFLNYFTKIHNKLIVNILVI